LIGQECKALAMVLQGEDQFLQCMLKITARFWLTDRLRACLV
jgi:hypothetical protein